MNLSRHGNAVPAPPGVVQDWTAAYDWRAFGIAFSSDPWASQDTESSGRETESSRDAGAPAAGTAPRSEVGTKAGENPGSDEGGGSLAQGARPGP